MNGYNEEKQREREDAQCQHEITPNSKSQNTLSDKTMSDSTEL